MCVPVRPKKSGYLTAKIHNIIVSRRGLSSKFITYFQKCVHIVCISITIFYEIPHFFQLQVVSDHFFSNGRILWIFSICLWDRSHRNESKKALILQNLNYAITIYITKSFFEWLDLTERVFWDGKIRLVLKIQFFRMKKDQFSLCTDRYLEMAIKTSGKIVKTDQTQISFRKISQSKVFGG